jgi:hypothetical protein
MPISFTTDAKLSLLVAFSVDATFTRARFILGYRFLNFLGRLSLLLNKKISVHSSFYSLFLDVSGGHLKQAHSQKATLQFGQHFVPPMIFEVRRRVNA